MATGGGYIVCTEIVVDAVQVRIFRIFAAFGLGVETWVMMGLKCLCVLVAVCTSQSKVVPLALARRVVHFQSQFGPLFEVLV